MLFFGHEGITLGAAAIIAGAVNKKDVKGFLKRPWFAALTGYIDVRLLFIGALLPDILDKPLGIYILKIDNGRVYAHTLLFLLIISVAGYLLYKSRKQMWLLILAAGTLAHFILDEMWRMPGTLFWPLMGLSFPREDLSDFLVGMFKEMFTNHYILTTELIGLLIVIWFMGWLISKRKLGAFVLHGKIS